jgi:hypothetical protein
MPASSISIANKADARLGGEAELVGTRRRAVGMSAGYVILTIVVGMFTVWMAISAVRLWRDPSRADQIMAAYSVLPVSQAVRRGTVRGAWPRAVVLACVTAIVPIGSVATDAQLQAGPLRVAALALVGLLILAGLVQLSIILFNRPRWIVPPAMRAEPGILTGGGDTKGRPHARARG